MEKKGELLKPREGSKSKEMIRTLIIRILTNANKNLDNNGTYIRVTNLYEEVSNLLIDESFLNDLTDDIERVLNFSLEKGIAITLKW